MKRSPLRRIGARAKRESDITPEHKRELDSFWARISITKISGIYKTNDIISWLCRLASLPGTKTCSRHHFDVMKSQITLRRKKCVACDEPATERHHIIPLDAGGPNCKLNIAPLCNPCHSAIHPWLNETPNREQPRFRSKSAKKSAPPPAAASPRF